MKQWLNPSKGKLCYASPETFLTYSSSGLFRLSPCGAIKLLRRRKLFSELSSDMELYIPASTRWRPIAFLEANKKRAYNRKEVAVATSVSMSAVRGILRDLHHEGKIEYHKVKERNGEIRAYYNWKRCDHLAANQCVSREKLCPEGKLCCIVCNRFRDCNMKCEIAAKLLGPEEEEE